MEKLVDAEAKCDVTAIVQLQAAIKFNGGGHLNHSIFWKVRQPKKISWLEVSKYSRVGQMMI